MRWARKIKQALDDVGFRCPWELIEVVVRGETRPIHRPDGEEIGSDLQKSLAVFAAVAVGQFRHVTPAF
jgi:hypothetical protein